MTHPRYNGRSQRVREYIAAHPGGVTLRQIIDATEPDCPRNNMGASLGTLVKLGKLRAEVAHRDTRYHATPTTLIDGRIAGNACGKRRKKPLSACKRTARHRQPAPAPAHPPTPRRKPVRAARAPLPRLQREDPRVLPAKPAGTAETVAEFQARGGRIQRLANGEVSQPLQYIGHQTLNDASWRARQQRDAA